MKFYRRWQRPQVVSFDLDDTLYDNVPVMQAAEADCADFIRQLAVQEVPALANWQRAEWQARRQQLLHADPHLAANMSELRRQTILRSLVALGMTPATAEDIANAALERFITQRSKLQIPASSFALLDALRQRYHVIAISNGNVDVPQTPLAGYFDLVLQPHAKQRGKPYGDMFEAAQQAFPRYQPSQFFHVGDHPISDVLGAHRAGWQSAWFTGGLGRADELKVLPNCSFDTHAQLQQLLA